jgi:hypothetical protein
MKSKLNMFAWSFATASAVYVAVGPGMGVLYHNPLATLGVALIGIGLCKEGRRRLQEQRV